MMVKELTANEQKEMLRTFVEKLYKNGFITETEFNDLKAQKFEYARDTDPNCYEFYIASDIQRWIVVSAVPYVDDTDCNADGFRTVLRYSGAKVGIYNISDKGRCEGGFEVYLELGEDKLKVKN